MHYFYLGGRCLNVELGDSLTEKGEIVKLFRIEGGYLLYVGLVGGFAMGSRCD